MQLRNKQANFNNIQKYETWSVEGDVLDSGQFNAMRRSLYTLAAAPQSRRAAFLGLRQPVKPPSNPYFQVNVQDESLQVLLNRMIGAPEYFLLWGPPGTGKTSVVLRALVEYYTTQTAHRIVVMAYTNRAVDEICAAIESIDPNRANPYIRIGSRNSTGNDFKSQLLSSRLAEVSTRRELSDLLSGQRVIVGTVAALSGKNELFELLNFDCAIVDEASQILEPQIAGLLMQFPKWIMIGDHKQLPAVVASPDRDTLVEDPDLAKIGLVDTRMSYFERMFGLCEKEGWDWALGKLYVQGRMHESIMAFPSTMFYEGMLKPLPASAFRRDLYAKLPPATGKRDDLETTIATQRVVYFPSYEKDTMPWSKLNNDEAEGIARLVKAIIRVNTARDVDWSIGIITPFRAQIANIRNALTSAEVEVDDLTIDTVERYQGSARDIIILSLCVTDQAQLRQISSLDRDGSDRKLNVALTRAREQFFWFGDATIVSNTPLFKALMEHSVICEQG